MNDKVPRIGMVAGRRRSEQAWEGLHAAQDALVRAIGDRCTCVDRDPALGPLEGHQPDCSLQSTGWLS